MKLKNITVYLSAILINSLSLNAQTTINLTPEYDAAIGYHDTYSTSGNNYGTATQNAAYSIPGTRGGVNNNRALIKFDLSGIPNGSNIISAKLDLYALGAIGTLSGHSGQNNDALLQRVTQNWNDSTVTWDSQPTATNQNETTLLPSTNPLQDYLNIDVTYLVQDMIDNNNYGFLLKLNNEDTTNALLFASSNVSDSNKHPKLEVYFSQTTTDIKKIKETVETFSIYPNPTKGFIIIDAISFNPKENPIINIFSSTGKLVMSKPMNQLKTEVNIEMLDSGIYFLKIITSNQVITKKIILNN
tara:strand:- start:67 stop:969 length:903 start_codon:yes stop_codon:yes gene_type:complete